MMTTDEYCDKLLQEYPEYISSDQMYRICHICKRTCRYLLEAKLIPCVDSGKKTRRYKINTTDVALYLKDREFNPKLYKAPENYYKTDQKPKPKLPYGRPITPEDLEIIRSFYERKIRRYSDVLTTEQISTITGYCKNSINKWCSKEHLKAFFIKQKYRVPKEYLLNFLVSSYFMSIVVKSQKHIAYDEEIRSLLEQAK